MAGIDEVGAHRNEKLARSLVNLNTRDAWVTLSAIFSHLKVVS